jgi:acetyl-CoA acetyltransferase
MSIKGKAAIAGIGELKPTRTVENRTGIGLLAEAARMAIDDAGLSKKDIDGIIVEAPVGESPGGYPSVLAEYLQIFPHFASTVGLQGATAAGMVWRAAAAIEAGMCTTVLCANASAISGGSISQQRLKRQVQTTIADFEYPYGPMGANSGYAMIAQRHAHEFGTTDEQRARIAVDHRTNACANPDALFYGQPITVEDVLNSRLVVDPLHLLEIVRPCSGAAAVVITSSEKAQSLPHEPVYILGAGEHLTHNSIVYAPNLTTSPIKIAADRAYRMAGVNPEDIDLVSVYDCYTITVLITLEDAGFCKKGEGGPFVQDTDLTYRGKLPVNTHGGQLSFGQPGTAGGMSHVTEAARQLMRRAGERQISGCELAYVNGNGGIMSDQCSLILGRNMT